MNSFRFPTTHWSMFARAAGASSDRDDLVRAYLPTIRHYLRRICKLTPEDVEDVSQEFAAQKFVSKNLFGSADRSKGKFRTYLLRSLDNFLVDRRRRERRSRAVGMATENRTSADEIGSSGADPVKEFDRTWAQNAMALAITRTFDLCTAGNRMDVWTVFERRLVVPATHGQAPSSYEDLARELELRSPMHAANLLVTGKRMFQRELRQVVAEYAGEGADFADELIDLKNALAGCAEVSRILR